MQLTLYMFKESVQNLDDCLLPDKVLKEKKVQLEQIDNGNALPDVAEYKIYWVKTGTKKPSWLDFVKSHLKPDIEKKLKNHTESLLILLKIKVAKNKYCIFATSGGYGYHIINEYKLEPNFGLKTALKTLSPDNIRQLDSIRPGTQTRQKREVTNISGRINTFDFECDSEILRTIAGDCDGNQLGDKVSGSDSLKLTGSGTFEDIGSKCRLSFETFSKTKLPEAFEFIDYIQHIKQQEVVDELDKKLTEALFSSGNNEALSLAYPDMLDMDAFEKFDIHGQRHKEEVSEINLESVRNYLDNAKQLEDADTDAQVNALRKGIYITGYDALIGQQKCTKPLYAYLTFEIDFDGNRYVFNNRKWYKVDTNYFQTVENFIDTQVFLCPFNHLSPWYLQQCTDRRGKRLTHHETLYNATYKDNDDFLVLDRKCFRKKEIIGRSQIEVADLYHRESKRLYCVKKYGQQGEFSHLLAQGNISAELLKREKTYREDFIKSLMDRWSDKKFNEPVCDESIFVYALGTTGDFFDKQNNLSFFAKLNLRKAVQSIKSNGFDVELTHIQMIKAEAPQSA